MPPRLLSSFEIQRYYQNESKFNSNYSRNTLPKIKDGANVVNFKEYIIVEFNGLLFMLNMM